MEYIPKTAVWELTMACNMHCAHCGSSCGNKPLPDELNPQEALKLCDELADLGLKLITLAGGEPLLRKDWPEITKALSDRGVRVNMVSNGWLWNERTIDIALESGLDNCAISIDGPEDVHNKIRCSGSFEKSVKALGIMKKKGLSSAVVTTVFLSNIDRLHELIPVFEETGVELWQFQIGLPMGNMSPDAVIKPEQVDQLIDFVHGLMEKSRIKVCLSDCLGYNTKKYQELIQAYGGKSTGWMGCNAGKYNLGILHDGAITGCTSMRKKELIEGNIRNTPLKTLWTRPGAFAWNRDFSVDDLNGFCGKCAYAETCLGGCKNVKLTITKGFDENPYCSYRNQIEKLNSKVENIFDSDTLFKRGIKAAELNLFETAELCFERADIIQPGNISILRNLGFAYYKCRQYEKSVEANKRALDILPDDSYSWKGLGNSLAKLKKYKEAETAFEKSIEYAEKSFMDPYYDLAVVLTENKEFEKALKVLERGIAKDSNFREICGKLIEYCEKMLCSAS